MRIGITGGTGFIGTNLIRRFGGDDHEFVILARGVDERNIAELQAREGIQIVTGSVIDRSTMREAFSGCDVIAHLAGINRERGTQTYENVHVEGTEAVVSAATDVGASKIVLTSYLRARPDCGSGYHESKWKAEEIVRRAGLDYTVVKPGVVYGAGDQMLTAISRSLATVPVFPQIGLTRRQIRPLAVDDLTDVLRASIRGDQLSETTVAVVGPETLTVAELVSRVGTVLGEKPIVIPCPVWAHRISSWIQERVMETPIVSTAGVRMLAEGATDPAPVGVCEPLPEALQPTREFSNDRIEEYLSAPERIGIDDFRL